ncbi:hypothetical protein ACFVZ8_16310 [Streptomyces sp. NPDC059558]|uniref:Uncharacterized protein n=1 Tax=Streptomyces virginiae TaxID=1961 RepID=A0A0L8N3M5_STRVG|nr:MULTISPECIES: hypothetical protein [Streptomyces]ARE72759.1 hypothetical protein B6R96_01340 [Streptomyces sp. Sge12]KOG57281.1 hypothetical protein ADK75_04645 [Streptomyces virginiae]KOU21359.1 hypothetical protein ADK51_23075 [Streptomyces sp. WM6368]
MLFARAPLDGVVWLDTLVHDPACGSCPRPREAEDDSEEDDADGIPVLSGRARNWMVAASAVTVVSAVLTVVAN